MKPSPGAHPSSSSASPFRLLVFRLSALGDVIHTIPAVVVLRAALPEMRVEWVVESLYRELVEIAAGVDVVPVRLKRWGREPFASHAEIRAAWRGLRGANVAVDFQGLVKSAALARLSGAKERYGFGPEAIREKPALLFTNHKAPVDARKHVVEQNLELAEFVRTALGGGSGAQAAPAWDAYPADPEQKLGAYRDAIVLLPGAGKPNKLWPVERFRELAHLLGDRAVVVWGPSERGLADAIGGRIAPPTNLRELAFVLQHARAVVGADTGPLHLAAALGTPVVGLYGPTDPRRNGPHGQLDRCIDEYRRTKLMGSISVEQVMKALDRVVVA